MTSTHTALPAAAQSRNITAASQGAVDFYLCALSRVHVACGQLHEEATSGASHCDAAVLAKVARDMLKGPVDGRCEAALTFTERLMRLAHSKTNQVLVEN